MQSLTTSRPLRDYQHTCIDLSYASIVYSWQQGMEAPFSGYYTLPTGTGKTRIATGLIEKLSKTGRVLVVAHRKELIEQMAAAIREDVPGSSVGIVMAERNEFFSPIIVGSIQTLRTDRLNEILIEGLWSDKTNGSLVALFIDEGHHITSDNSYCDLILAVRQAYPQCAVIACTATPFRSDKGSMQSVLPTCTFSRSIPDMQKAGWLCPLEWNPMLIPFDEHAVRISSIGGEKDYKAEDLETLLSPQSITIVEKTRSFLENRPTLVFASTVKHAQELSLAYREAGMTAKSIWGDMPRQEREDYLQAWKQGVIQVIVNVGILTEGFDYVPVAPNTHGLSALVVARPTLSPSLYLQMLGRGTRLKPTGSSYQNCLVLDVVGNANLLETRQITLNDVMPTHTEASEHVNGKRKPAKKSDHTKPAVLKLNAPLELSWAAWGFDPASGVYYCSIGEKCYAVCIPDNSGSGLYYGYVLTEELDTSQGEEHTHYAWRKQLVTRRPVVLQSMMQHLNHVFAQHGKKSLVDKGSAWRQGLPSDAALKMLAWKDRRVWTWARSEGWNAGEVSLAITWAVLQRPVSFLLHNQKGSSQ